MSYEVDVAGWLVIQVAAAIVPPLHLQKSLTTVVIVILLGFPVARQRLGL